MRQEEFESRFPRKSKGTGLALGTLAAATGAVLAGEAAASEIESAETSGLTILQTKGGFGATRDGGIKIRDAGPDLQFELESNVEQDFERYSKYYFDPGSTIEFCYRGAEPSKDGNNFITIWKAGGLHQQSQAGFERCEMKLKSNATKVALKFEFGNGTLIECDIPEKDLAPFKDSFGAAIKNAASTNDYLITGNLKVSNLTKGHEANVTDALKEMAINFSDCVSKIHEKDLQDMRDTAILGAVSAVAILILAGCCLWKRMGFERPIVHTAGRFMVHEAMQIIRPQAQVAPDAAQQVNGANGREGQNQV